jgi:hypothetical protein
MNYFSHDQKYLSLDILAQVSLVWIDFWEPKDWRRLRKRPGREDFRIRAYKDEEVDDGDDEGPVEAEAEDDDDDAENAFPYH